MQYIEKDPALARRFQPVLVTEPSVEDAISILRGRTWKGRQDGGLGVGVGVGAFGGRGKGVGWGGRGIAVVAPSSPLRCPSRCAFRVLLRVPLRVPFPVLVRAPVCSLRARFRSK